MKILSKIIPILSAFCCYTATSQRITQKAAPATQYVLPKTYADELTALNNFFPGKTNFPCWKFEVNGRLLVLKFRDDTECKVDFAAIDHVTTNNNKEITISCINNKKCIDFGGGRQESSIRMVNTDNESFFYLDLATLINTLVEAVRYATLTDTEWEAYTKKMQPKNEAVWKAALNDLNDYLLMLYGPKAQSYMVQGKYVIALDENNKPQYKFHIDDVMGAFVAKKNMTLRESVVIGSDDKLMMDGIYSYHFKDRDNAIQFYNTPQNKKKDLVNKLNTFLFALKGTPVPDALAIKEDVKTEADEIRAKAVTAFEKTMAEIKIFLLNRPYGSTYFTGTSYSNNSLVIETIKDKETILLDRVGYVTINELDGSKPVVYIRSSSKGYCDIYNGSYYEKSSFSDFNKEDALHFFQLLGNMMDAYKEEISKEKQDISYAEKYKLVTSPGYLEKIEAGSVVKITGVQDSDKNKRKIRKLIDEEVTLATSLDINSDMQSYTGDLLDSKGDRMYASAVMVSYVKGKNGENIVEQKAAQMEKNKIQAAKEAEHNRLLLQGLKFVHQFLEASQAGNYSKYLPMAKLVETGQGDQANRYQLSLTDMPAFIETVFLYLKPGNDKLTSVALNFDKEYTDLMFEILDYKKAGFRLEETHYESFVTGEKTHKALFVNNESLIILEESIVRSIRPRLLIYEVKGLIKH